MLNVLCRLDISWWWAVMYNCSDITVLAMLRYYSLDGAVYVWYKMSKGVQCMMWDNAWERTRDKKTSDESSYNLRWWWCSSGGGNNMQLTNCSRGADRLRHDIKVIFVMMMVDIILWLQTFEQQRVGPTWMVNSIITQARVDYERLALFACSWWVCDIDVNSERNTITTVQEGT